ncbi:nucleotidyltransferase domain-containing protein [Marinobacterium iners]|uniref:Nucleotidyltransferase domain-containing protein n=1 Tax=Marinobacterium iners DSM 11526 TaxID=1122198 RepID=A0A1H4BWW0_9GAMM|nr:nucleotidyltransferase domain-containing protein [Marinobacterium iners]SEA52332.1 Nucleotidyltransferase domain-containing protein [Marinobacterium iners DSM 11526]
MKYTIMDDFPQITAAKKYTGSQLQVLRQEIAQCLSGSEYSDAITVVTTGSYGRGEATAESDLDCFILFDRDLPAEDVISKELEAISDVMTRHIEKSAGDTGTFGPDARIRFSDMLVNIGGQHDTNESLTRRLLFLLEGTWLFNEQSFTEYRQQLLEKHIKSGSPDEQVPRFLLNDIIRYYRTIATDFEFKTSESKKSWGLRNIKLRFSRKLLYFSGIIVAAELKGLEREDKIQRALELFDQTGLQRLQGLGEELNATNEILKTYESFMAHLSQPVVRAALDKVQKEQRMQCPEYKALRTVSHEFSCALHEWLKEKYGVGHPIHHALVF